MKSIYFALFLMFGLITQGYGQSLKQTIRGTILDMDSKLPIIGAAVVINNGVQLNTVTDVNGNFRLENVPVGRTTLLLSYIGYESQTIPNIEVNSGKEVVLDLSMQESVVKIEEVVVKALKNKGKVTNEMSLLSARSFSIEESKRFAGGFDDPSRMVTNYAGAASTPSGNSDIIVRGNAPKYIQWRLEGIEITNPYHFDDQNSSIGGLSALNNSLLNTSDFYTGAFSPEYGNVLSSVLDIKLRAGNNEKFEGAVGAGLIGTDITLEGPFKKGYSGSYLFNYRYSTVGLAADLGLVDMPGLASFQDATMKLVFPTQKLGTFSVFALGGLDNWKIEDVRASLNSTPGNRTMTDEKSEDWNKGNFLLNSGINNTFTITKNSFIKSTLSYSGNGINDEITEMRTAKIYNPQGAFLRDSIYNKRLNFDNNILKSVYRASVTYNNKINSRSKFQLGTKYTLYNYDFRQSLLTQAGAMFDVVNFKENITTVQNFISWQLRFNDAITMVTGVHNMNVLLNSKSTFEPRIALNWKLNETNSVHAGYGNHSSMESVHHYFASVQQPDGSISQPNKNLGLLRAHHFVAGYEKRFTENLMAKVELYYQHLYNLPVENNDTSYFATINEGLDYRYVNLVNKGTGKNYGAEITVERFFDKNYYFMINATLFESKYKSLENVERNTVFNQNYLANIIFGKEFHNLGKKKNQMLGINAKVFLQGGQRYIPLLRNTDGSLAADPANNRFWDYSKAYENYLDRIYQLNVSFSYKWNKQKTTHELFLDLQNLTGNAGKINEYYDASEPNSIGYLKQWGFFPNMMYRVYF